MHSSQPSGPNFVKELRPTQSSHSCCSKLLLNRPYFSPDADISILDLEVDEIRGDDDNIEDKDISDEEIEEELEKQMSKDCVKLKRLKDRQNLAIQQAVEKQKGKSTTDQAHRKKMSRAQDDKSHSNFNGNRINAFTYDVTNEELCDKIFPSSVDFITLIFMLSAVSPNKMLFVLQNLKKVLKGHLERNLGDPELIVFIIYI